jgi:septal ring factor EnvC (AmiA/AmiB activator)
MSECNLQEAHIADIATLKSKVEGLEVKMDKLDGIEKNLERLATLIEVQQEDRNEQKIERKEQQKVLSELTQTNIKTYEMIDKLNTKIDSTDKKLDVLKCEIEETSSRGMFNWIDLITKKLIPVLLTSGVIYSILKLSGKI